ncbi:signal-regulatory protein beta-1-like isoform X3 [Anguilla anguilla]|uniref:signal-regulatory protein beta-1-like isoform X3 n=1 Tax=Anguilla anguilla TaxID=7936 RepID=UPI0015B335B0|nr:signal-regulatory protein beta-1-like isoform X3 [Anguilla anguilla]
MPVHILTGLLPWLLFKIILLFTGVSGSEPTVYSSAGELVTLPCNLSGSFNCSSITWNWYNGRSQGAIELVAHGAVEAKDQQIARRLRVRTDCSLHINNLTTADAGWYYCRLYHNDENSTEVSVYLSILNIFASSPVTELKIGSTVTLVCKLHSPRPCGRSVNVSWVSETGVQLQGNRYKLSESECSSNLTVTLERSDHNMKWRCQLTVEGKQKASHSYTTSFPGVSGSELTVYSSAGELASHSYTTIFPDKITRDVWIGSGVAVCVAVVLIVILIMICRRRTVQRKTAHNPVSQSHTVTDQNKGESEDTVTYAVVNPSAGGKRKQDQESAVLETEYAIIKTSQKSNKP